MGVGRRMGKKQGMPDVLKVDRLAASSKPPRGKKRKASGVVNPPPKKSASKDAKRKTLPPTSSKEIAMNLDENEVPSDLESDQNLLDTEEDEDVPELEDDGGIFSSSSVYDSDQEEGHRKVMFSDEDDDSDAAEERLTAANIEGLSRKLDAEREAEAANAQLELEESAMQTNIAGDRPKILEDSDSDSGRPKTTLSLAPDLQLLRSRITETIRVLEDFSNLAEEGRSRADYTAQLHKDVCVYYGYSEFLAEKLLALFPPKEAFDFFEAQETPRPVVLRTNTLKTNRRELAQTLISSGVTLEPVGKWSKVGIQVFSSNVPLGATPSYLAGHYMVQAASSFLPTMALAPKPNERVLDMSASPGGKTTHIAALQRNTGVIFANDSNRARSKALIANCARLGVKNVICTNYDARAFPNVIGGFDRALLDAPCTGTGVIAKDPSVKTNKTAKDFLALPHLQKQLLLAAIDSVNHKSQTGGYLVYSTCSVSVEENEMVVQYALRKRPNVKIVETGLPFGVDAFTNFMGKAFDPSMKLAKRYYPHTYNMDGFFVCKLHKTGPSPNQKASASRGSSNGVSLESQVNGEAEVDKTPIGAEEARDDFGGWDEEEDNAYMVQAVRRNLKRKGINPKADKRKSQAKTSAKI